MDISELLSISEPPRAPPSRRHRAPNLTRDQRRDILNTYQFNHSNKEISATLGITLRQVEYTLEANRATLKKASGPAGKLNKEQLVQLAEFTLERGSMVGDSLERRNLGQRRKASKGVGYPSARRRIIS